MTKTAPTKLLTLLLIVATNYLVFTSSAIAQNALGLSAIPPRLEVQAEPGSTVTKEIKIRNESKSERVITTSTKDFIVTDDSGTPIQLEGLDESANRWASASWIQVSPTNFRLKPGETKSLVVTFLVPEDALAGGHYAMVLHSPKNEAVLDDTGAFVETNVGSLIYITVPGDIKEEAKVRDFSAPSFLEFGPVDFKATVTNLSDIHITPAGSIAIKNWFGGKTADLPLTLTNIFPNTNREINTTLNRKWMFGRYAATLNAGYGTTGQVLTATLFFWVFPWRLIALLIVALVLIFIIIKLVKNHPRQLTQENTQVEELEKELDALKKKYKDRK